MRSLRVSTRREVLIGIPERIKHQYCRDGVWYDCSFRPEQVYARLMALDLTVASAEEVDAAVGNGSWTRHCCASCEENVDAAIEIAAEEYSECGDTLVCAACLSTATAMLTERAPVLAPDRSRSIPDPAVAPAVPTAHS